MTTLNRAFTILVCAAFGAGLTSAYLAAVAGLLSIADARTAALIAFGGVALALVAATVYVLAEQLRLDRAR